MQALPQRPGSTTGACVRLQRSALRAQDRGAAPIEQDGAHLEASVPGRTPSISRARSKMACSDAGPNCWLSTTCLSGRVCQSSTSGWPLPTYWARQIWRAPVLRRLRGCDGWPCPLGGNATGGLGAPCRMPQAAGAMPISLPASGQQLDSQGVLREAAHKRSRNLKGRHWLSTTKGLLQRPNPSIFPTHDATEGYSSRYRSSRMLCIQRELR